VGSERKGSFGRGSFRFEKSEDVKGEAVSFTEEIMMFASAKLNCVWKFRVEFGYVGSEGVEQFKKLSWDKDCLVSRKTEKM
jgi:hypothetical protein